MSGMDTSMELVDAYPALRELDDELFKEQAAQICRRLSQYVQGCIAAPKEGGPETRRPRAPALSPSPGLFLL